MSSAGYLLMVVRQSGNYVVSTIAKCLQNQDAIAVIPDQETYLVSCEVSKVLVLSFFSTRLVSCGTLSISQPAIYY